MKKRNLIMLFVGLFVTGPIWYYLLYKILEGVSASELMWFLYWVYVPVAVVLNAIAKLTDED